MKAKVIKLIIVSAVAVGLCSPVHAALIGAVDNGSYVTDTQTGIDWYKPTESLGWSYSYSYVQSQFGVGGEFEGLRYATAAEFGQMVDNLTGLFTGITGVEQSFNLWGSNPDSAQIKDLIDLFGTTYLGGGIGGTKFLLGYLADQNGAGDPYFGRITSTAGSYGGNGVNTNFGNSSDRVGGITGSWLVRASVPEPGAMLLFLSGIGAIMFIRRKRTIS